MGKKNFYEWDETLFTWCDDCGNDNDEVGRMRECPYCGDNMCRDCARGHSDYCVNEED